MIIKHIVPKLHIHAEAGLSVVNPGTDGTFSSFSARENWKTFRLSPGLLGFIGVYWVDWVCRFIGRVYWKTFRLSPGLVLTGRRRRPARRRTASCGDPPALRVRRTTFCPR